MTMIMTVLRGLRSRALLSGGSVLLISLAIGSAVLGPIFSAAVTDSFLVSRLAESPNALTGLSWRFVPTPGDRGGRRGRESAAEQATADAVAARRGPGARPVRPTPDDAGDRADARSTAVSPSSRPKPGACEHLEIDEGSCPTRPGEVMLLDGDLELTGSEIGQRVDLGELGTVDGRRHLPGPGAGGGGLLVRPDPVREHPADSSGAG